MINEQIQELLDEFTTPYNNDKVIELMEKLRCHNDPLSNTGHFEQKHLDEIQTYLISKKGFSELCYTYNQSDLDFIETSIDMINEIVNP